MSRSYISSSGVERLRVGRRCRPTDRRARLDAVGHGGDGARLGIDRRRARPSGTASTPRPPARARTDHAPNTVLCGAFWLKSTKMRSPRSSFHHASVISVGRRRASSRATRDRGARAPGSASTAVRAARTRGCRGCRWSSGQPADAELVEQRPCSSVRGVAHVVEAEAGLRIEVDAQLVGVLVVAGDVGPHVEAEAPEVDRPRDVREVGGDQRLRRRAVRRADDRRLEPVGPFLRAPASGRSWSRRRRAGSAA